MDDWDGSNGRWWIYAAVISTFGMPFSIAPYKVCPPMVTLQPNVNQSRVF